MAAQQIDPDEEKRRGVEKILGEPVFLEFTEQTATARRNLLFASCIAVAFWYWGLRLSSAPSLMGLQLENLSARAFVSGLLWAVLYLEIHFVWLAWDGVQEWRLRQSGLRSAFQPGTKGASNDADYPKDARQSTLYRWWSERMGPIADLERAIADTAAIINEIRTERPLIEWTQQREHRLAGLDQNLSFLRGAWAGHVEAVKSARLPPSLARFDAAFGRFLRSQNLRWIALEFGVPAVGGLAALAACIAMLLAASRAPLPAVSVAAHPPAISASATSQPFRKP